MTGKFGQSRTCMQNRTEYYIIRTGYLLFVLVLITLVLPMKYSLYATGSFVICGFGLAIAAPGVFKVLLRKYRLLILAPLLYFSIYLFDIILRGGEPILIQERLLFLVFPVFTPQLFSSEYFRKRFRELQLIFIFSIAAISIYQMGRVSILLIKSTGLSFELFSYFSQHIFDFTASSLSGYDHPTYLSLKVVLAIGFLLFNASMLRLSVCLKLILLFLLSAFVLMLASRAGILTLLIVLLWFLIYFFRNQTRRKWLIIIIPVFFAFISLVVVKNYRVQLLLKSVKEMSEETENIGLLSIDFRPRIWYSCMEIIVQHPVVGVGIKRSQHELNEVYIKNGFSFEAKSNYNAHNQFFEALIAFGFVGLIALVTLLSSSLIFIPAKGQSILLKLFLVLFTINILFESMLNRQWGIIMFLLFQNFLVFSYRGVSNELKA